MNTQREEEAKNGRELIQSEWMDNKTIQVEYRMMWTIGNSNQDYCQYTHRICNDGEGL